MRLLTKIACRTIGVAGMGVALYDASRIAGQFARNGAQDAQAKYLETTYFNSRTTDNVSFSENNIRKKTFDLHTKNPLPSIWGKVKGGVQGFMYGLGNYLPGIACASLAILSKGFMAKVGAVGLALGACYKVARNGLGLGKQHPMD